MTNSWWVLWKRSNQVSTILFKPKLVWLLVDENELSADVETVLLVKSLSSFWLSFIDVDDSPLLVKTIVSVIGNNFLSFLVCSTINIET
jgi:hypothetical protein